MLPLGMWTCYGYERVIKTFEGSVSRTASAVIPQARGNCSALETQTAELLM